MTDPVQRVTIHHEGAGSPCTKAQASRFSEGGYCYAICTDGWVRFRSPAQNWATRLWNHKDLTICLSGNRMDHDVTDADIASIHASFMDCYNRGEVHARADVVAHRNSPGSSTACPGNRTMDRWNEVVAACRPTAPTPPAPEPPSEEDDMVIISVADRAQAGNQQPYAFLDAKARKVWSFWGFKVSWDGGSGDSPLQGDKDPKSFNVPGSAPLMGWDVLETRSDGSKRICVFGNQGAQYTGTAHG